MSSDRTGLSTRQKQIEYAQKLTKDQELRERSRQELSILAATKEMQPCTFHPNLKGTVRKVSVRKAKEFFEKEVDFREKRNQKIENEKQKRKALESIQRYQHKPGICKGSQKILKKKSLTSRSPVHQRLYENKHQNALIMNQVLETSLPHSETSVAVTASFKKEKRLASPFQPTINQRSKQLHRNQDIVTLLHQDAKRREQRKKVTMSARTPSANAIVSKNSEVLMFQKFEHRLTREFRNLDQSEQGLLDYEHFSTLLSNLDFLFTDQYKVAKEVPEMLYDLWECVCPQPYGSEQDEIDGKQSGQFTFTNMRVILAGILNFHFKWMDKPLLEQKIEETGGTSDAKWVHDLRQKVEKQYGVEFSKSGDVSLSPEGQQMLHSKFKGLYYIYHENYTHSRKQKAKIKFIKPSFSPSLCNRSKILDVSGEMTQKKNQRHEMLIAKGREYSKKKEEMRKERQTIEEEGCSFRPKILGEEAAKKVLLRSNSSQDLREKNLEEFDQMLKQRARLKFEEDIDFIDGDTGGVNRRGNSSYLQKTMERRSRLQKLATPKQRLQLKQEDLEFYRNHEQCSFHPKISKYEQPKRKKERVIKKITSYGNKKHELTPPSIDHLVNQKQLKGMLQELNLSAHSQAQKQMKSFEERMKLPPSPPSEIERIIEETTPDLTEAGHRSSPKVLGQQDAQFEEESEQQVGDVILEMNVKLEDGRSRVLLIRDGESAKEAASRFAQETGISASLEKKLEGLVEQQLNSVLSKILEEEEMSSKQA